MAEKDKEKVEEGLPTVRTCGTEKVHLRLLLEEPGYAARRAEIENQAWRASEVFRATGRSIVGRSGCTRIPVVVHVVYRTVAENISQAQIDSQIDVLNQDFRHKNTDVGTAPAVFQPLSADARIEFQLASTDPQGNATNGVTRTQTTVNGFTDDDKVKSVATGGADAWPSDQYLNLWVCRLAGGLLGYAQFPGGPAATDGVVITYTGFGTTGTAAPPFNRGRTAVHEIGHWLNLRHIWGDDHGGCSGSDFVSDTPNQGGPNYGSPPFPTISCSNGPNGDMFMNYMDYVDDPAMVMFTTGQVTRMQAALDGPRASIGTTIPCGAKLKFADEPVTLKFRDDIPKTKFADEPITLKFSDDPKSKFTDDPKFKFTDDPKSKFTDDPKFKFTDEITKQPFGEGTFLPTGMRSATGQPAPFVLSTPHHSRAWEGTAATGADPTLAAYEQQLAQYERILKDYKQAEEAGQLGENESRALQELYAEYVRLAEEYRQLSGGQA